MFCRTPGTPSLRIKTRDGEPLAAPMTLAGSARWWCTPKTARLISGLEHAAIRLPASISTCPSFQPHRAGGRTLRSSPAPLLAELKAPTQTRCNQDIVFSWLLDGTWREFTRVPSGGRLEHIQAELKLVQGDTVCLEWTGWGWRRHQ